MSARQARVARVVGGGVGIQGKRGLVSIQQARISVGLRQRAGSFVALVALLTAAAAGCDKGTPTPTDTAKGAVSSAEPATSAPPAASGSASGSASAAASGGAPEAAGAAERWKGSFKTKVGLVTPPEKAEVKVWTKDPGTEAIGDGTITLSVSGKGPGRTVDGTADGALGDLLIRGELDDKELSARVDPKTPNAPGAMTGVLQGKRTADGIEATLRVSGRNGNIVREATIKLAKE